MKHTQISPVTMYPPLVQMLLSEENHDTAQRKELLRCIDMLWGTATSEVVIDLPQHAAVIVSSIKNATTFYNKLCDFLESNEEHYRLILYLPFDLLPEYSFRSSFVHLTSVLKRFVELYRKIWHVLLNDIDYRSVFSDGDIVDTEYAVGMSPQVSKAAHLIPILIQKNLVTVKEVIDLCQISSNDVVKQSIVDALGVVFDMGLLIEKDIESLSLSSDGLLRNTAILLLDSKKSAQVQPVPPRSIGHIMIQLHTAVEKIDAMPQRTAREKWQKNVAIDTAVDQSSAYLCKLLSDDRSIGIEDIDVMVADYPGYVVARAAIITVRKFCESLVRTNQYAAKHACLTFLPKMERMYHEYSDAVQESIETTLYHWCNIGLISHEHMSAYELLPKRLGVPCDPYVIIPSSQQHVFDAIVDSIGSDKLLSAHIYPVVIVYGSRIKGYALKDTDDDIAFFIKPGVHFSQRAHIQSLLAQLLSTHGIHGNALEMWLRESNGRMIIKDFASDINGVGCSAMSYVLFQSIWIGATDLVDMLYTKICFPYFSRTHLNQFSTRRIWIREMERDTLQYRLMHKGYARLYPTEVLFTGHHAKDIDADSVFWDPGYRRLATRLFISSVYLPK